MQQRTEAGTRHEMPDESVRILDGIGSVDTPALRYIGSAITAKKGGGLSICAVAAEPFQFHGFSSDVGDLFIINPLPPRRSSIRRNIAQYPGSTSLRVNSVRSGPVVGLIPVYRHPRRRVHSTTTDGARDGPGQ
ncbi:hypothetical protein ACQPZ2_07485 [Nocardia pseudovaccinii]|uniref:hypothetical protein n=1 Tax=Nocardia pseudovaccinii TaxID=189540 RepID=UPI003D9468F0